MKKWSDSEDHPSSFNKFFKLTEEGKIEQLKKYFQDFEPETKNIDVAIRKCLSRFEEKKENQCATIKELFSHADLNYINSNYNNTNIIMNCCEIGEPYLINLLLSEKYFMKNKQKPIVIDLCKLDKNNSNIFHYLFNKNEFEYDTIEIFNHILNYANITHNMTQIESLLLKPDNEGITPLIIILTKGWYEVLNIYFS